MKDMRIRPGDSLVIATGNPAKIAEFRRILGRLDLNLLGMKELGLSEPEETGQTYAENAELKARIAAEESGLPSLADDSGLEVFALAGAPGLYTGRFARKWSDSPCAAEVEVLSDAARIGNYGARMAGVVSLAFPGDPDPMVVSAIGCLEGELVESECIRGAHGFESLFQPQGVKMPYHRLSPEMQDTMSHRSRALKALAMQTFVPELTNELPAFDICIEQGRKCRLRQGTYLIPSRVFAPSL